MDTPAPASDSPIVVGNFEVALQVSQSRTIKMSGYLFAKDTVDDINHRIDDLQTVIDRQAVRADVQNKEAQVEAHRLGLEQMAEHFEELYSRQKKGAKLVSQEKQTIATSEMQVRNAKRNIASLEAAIKVGRAKLNGAAAP